MASGSATYQSISKSLLNFDFGSNLIESQQIPSINDQRRTSS